MLHWDTQQNIVGIFIQRRISSYRQLTSRKVTCLPFTLPINCSSNMKEHRSMTACVLSFRRSNIHCRTRFHLTLVMSPLALRYFHHLTPLLDLEYGKLLPVPF